MGGQMVEKADVLTKILSLAYGTCNLFLLHDSVSLESAKFVVGAGSSLLLRDGKGFTLKLAEHTHGGRVLASCFTQWGLDGGGLERVRLCCRRSSAFLVQTNGGELAW